MRALIAIVFLAMLVAGGYIWHQTNREATDRAEWLADPTPEDDTQGVSLFASGFLGRDIVVSAYILGDEDRSTEDMLVEKISHGDLAAEFYRQGFRRIVTYGSETLSRTITIASPESSKMQKEEYDELSARLIE